MQGSWDSSTLILKMLTTHATQTMSKVIKGELKVPAICNGSVIDHIPVSKLMDVVRLLRLEQLPYPLTIGQNFSSSKFGTKGIIKVESKLFTPEEVDKLALVSSEIVINVIQDYKVVKKIKAELPGEIIGIVQCTNPKCVSNNEPMKSRFCVIDARKTTLRCLYCNRKIDTEDILICPQP